MTLDEKLEAFQAGTLAATEVDGRRLNQLEIGRENLIGAAMAEPASSMQSNLICKRGGVFIGRHSYMNNLGYVRDGVFIGRYTSIGRRVTIGAGAHVMSGLSTSPALSSSGGPIYTNDERMTLGIPERRDSRFTTLMNDVWIGDGAVITRGITIHTGAVVGANSVVTKDVPAYAVVGGAPARVIRFRFPQEIVTRLLATNYWDLPHDFLRSLPISHVMYLLETLEQRSLPEFEQIATYQLR